MGRYHQEAIDAKRGGARDRSEREQRSINPNITPPTRLPAGFVPITEVASALGMSVAALQRWIDHTGRARTVVARDGQVLVHREEALALKAVQR